MSTLHHDDAKLSARFIKTTPKANSSSSSTSRRGDSLADALRKWNPNHTPTPPKLELLRQGTTEVEEQEVHAMPPALESDESFFGIDSSHRTFSLRSHASSCEATFIATGMSPSAFPPLSPAALSVEASYSILVDGLQHSDHSRAHSTNFGSLPDATAAWKSAARWVATNAASDHGFADRRTEPIAGCFVTRTSLTQFTVGLILEDSTYIQHHHATTFALLHAGTRMRVGPVPFFAEVRNAVRSSIWWDPSTSRNTPYQPLPRLFVNVGYRGAMLEYTTLGWSPLKDVYPQAQVHLLRPVTREFAPHRVPTLLGQMRRPFTQPPHEGAHNDCVATFNNLMPVCCGEHLISIEVPCAIPAMAPFLPTLVEYLMPFLVVPLSVPHKPRVPPPSPTEVDEDSHHT